MEKPLDENYFNHKNIEFAPLKILGILLLAVFTGWLIGSMLMYIMSIIGGWNLADGFPPLTDESEPHDRDTIRLALMISHLSMFIFPAIITGRILFKKLLYKKLALNRFPVFNNIVLGIMMMLLAFPLVQLSYWLNQQIPLPEWMMNAEGEADEMIKNLLITKAPYELFFNLLIIAILPAIGEEMVFRGFIQRQLSRVFQNPIIAIWVSAIIFSAIHFQFQGFFPRMLLGAVLGYLFYWTGNLWIPIIVHFFNNATQLIAQHLFLKDISDIDLDSIEHIPWSLAAFSFAAIIGIAFLIKKNNLERALKI